MTPAVPATAHATIRRAPPGKPARRAPLLAARARRGGPARIHCRVGRRRGDRRSGPMTTCWLLAHLAVRDQRPRVSGQVSRNSASALPEAILERSEEPGIASKKWSTAAAPGWWNG